MSLYVRKRDDIKKWVEGWKLYVDRTIPSSGTDLWYLSINHPPVLSPGFSVLFLCFYFFSPISVNLTWNVSRKHELLKHPIHKPHRSSPKKTKACIPTLCMCVCVGGVDVESWTKNEKGEMKSTKMSRTNCWTTWHTREMEMEKQTVTHCWRKKKPQQPQIKKAQGIQEYLTGQWWTLKRWREKKQYSQVNMAEK